MYQYGTRAMLEKNGIISSPIGYDVDSPSHKSSTPSATTSYGGKTFKPSANPLTVIYDPHAD